MSRSGKTVVDYSADRFTPEIDAQLFRKVSFMETLDLICPELQISIESASRRLDPWAFTQRLPLRIPIRVCEFDSARIEFAEDIYTRIITASGALIALGYEVFAPDTLRIINLQNYFEGDFRVVGPTRM